MKSHVGSSTEKKKNKVRLNEATFSTIHKRGAGKTRADQALFFFGLITAIFVSFTESSDGIVTFGTILTGSDVNGSNGHVVSRQQRLCAF